jgi:hypothetical protein
MKRTLHYHLFALFFLAIATPEIVQAQCTVTVTPATDTLCVGDSTTLTAAIAGPSLFTTMAGGNSHRGNMFDLTAINTVTITQFDGNPASTTNIAVYYRAGTHVGFEQSSVGWTLIGTANNVVPIGSPTPTPFPIPINVTIPAGQTYAFYVTSTNTAVSLNYTNGTAVGNVLVSDGNLQFKEGKGLEYPFGNGAAPFSTRNWNGRIHYTAAGSGTYAWSNGATTPSIVVAPSSTTTYTVTATSGGTCNASATVITSAVNVDLGADTAYCQGGLVTLDAGSGTTFLWSNGATTQTTTGVPGLNWAQVSDALGCTDADTVQLTENTPPVVNLGTDTLLCGVSAVILDAGNSGSSFVWSTGGTASTETVSTSGNYFVQVTDTNGCMGGDSISLLIGNPSIFLGADTTLCNAASTILSVGGGWASILWSNGSSNNFININATNTYHATVMDSAGCSASDTISVTASANPVASFGVSGDAGCVQATVTNGSLNATSYQWIWGDGNTSFGFNPGPHAYSQPYFGDITLIVGNDCGSDTLLLPFGCVGISSGQFFGSKVYPNPNNGRFKVAFEGLETESLTLEILNIQGQPILFQNHVFPNSQFETELDLGKVSKGIYILKVKSDISTEIKRIIVE